MDAVRFRSKEWTIPERYEVLQAGGTHGGGNQLFLYHFGPEAPVERAVLKVYRGRNTPFKQLVKSVSHLLIERKRGIGARARYETERLALEIWRREGFDVPALLDLPAPVPTPEGPYVWLEFLPGVPLSDFIEDPDAPFDDKVRYVERLGQELARRQRRALEISEPLLIQEHASVKHVIVDGERMVHFDLEGGYRPGFDITEAATQELSGILRSLARKGECHLDAYLRALVTGYGDHTLLTSLVDHGLECRSLYRHFKRKHDMKRRQTYSKTEMLDTIRSLLSASAPGSLGSPGSDQ